MPQAAVHSADTVAVRYRARHTAAIQTADPPQFFRESAAADRRGRPGLLLHRAQKGVLVSVCSMRCNCHRIRRWAADSRWVQLRLFVETICCQVTFSDLRSGVLDSDRRLECELRAVHSLGCQRNRVFQFASVADFVEVPDGFTGGAGSVAGISSTMTGVSRGGIFPGHPS